LALLALAPAALAYKGFLLSDSAVARRGRLLGLLLLLPWTMLGVSVITLVDARSPRLGPAFAAGRMLPMVARQHRGRLAAPSTWHYGGRGCARLRGARAGR